MNSFLKWSVAVGVLVSVVHSASGAIALEPLYSFGRNTNVNGSGPSELMQGADGNLYGATFSGGLNGNGTLFRITTNGTLTTLFALDGANGSAAGGRLVQDNGGVLYGTASAGGSNNDGALFKLTTNGTFTLLASFGGTNELKGASPYVGLAIGTNGLLYGVTTYGGTNDHGTVFVVTTNGVVIAQAFFNGTNGSLPSAALVQAVDGNFYGATSQGGSNGFGTIFRLTPQGVLSSVFSFGGTNGGFGGPTLVQGQDGNLYGATSAGGTFGHGTVFKLTLSAALTVLHHFNYANGQSPASLLQAPDGKLYGSAHNGGDNGIGVIFTLTTNGAFTLVRSFTNSLTEGAVPRGLIRGADDVLYGVTVSGGLYNQGTIFRMTTNGALTSLVSFLPFGSTDGAGPRRPVLGPGGIVYGVTDSGGAYGFGTVFSVTTSGAHTRLHSFTGGTNGASPACLMFARDGQLYGATSFGGLDYGTLFRITTNGTLTTLYTFTNQVGFVETLVQGIDNDFYGVSSDGGVLGNGTFFKITSAGVYTVLHSFDSDVDGRNPNALLQRNDGTFYGLAPGGGTNNGGTIFKATASGAVTLLRTLVTADGYDLTDLISGLDGNLYGTAEHGGPTVTSDGVAFKITTNGVFTILHAFQIENEGFGPLTLVQGSDGHLYGTTASGGANGVGTLFRLKTNGAFAVLATFIGTNTGAPARGMVLGKDLSVYGTTAFGGAFDWGTFFRFTVPPNPSISSQPASTTNSFGAIASFTVDADGVLPLKYQWRKNLINLSNGGNVSGATSATLTLSNLSFADVGSYSVVVTNNFGTVTSSNATLTVLPTLPDALDAITLSWTTGGDALWFGQPWTTHDGVDAGQSGIILDWEETWIETTVNGPGVLTFWWKVSSEGAYDFLNFYVNDELRAFISGETGWQQESFNVPAGGQSLRWNYEKDFNISLGLDRGWLDQVNFVALPPAPVFQPLIRTNNNLIVRWSTVPGRTYQLLTTTNLAQPNWQSLGSPGTNGSVVVPIGPDRERYFRVLVVP